MKYLHTMVRISDVEKSLHFYRDLLGLKEVRRWVVGLVIACVALLFLSVAKNVIKDAHSEQREAQEVPDGR